MDKRINGKIKMINWKWSFWAKIEQKNVAKQRVRDNFFFFFLLNYSPKRYPFMLN